MFSEGNAVQLEMQLEARKVAGSDKYKQNKAVRDCVVLF